MDLLEIEPVSDSPLEEMVLQIPLSCRSGEVERDGEWPPNFSSFFFEALLLILLREFIIYKYKGQRSSSNVHWDEVDAILSRFTFRTFLIMISILKIDINKKKYWLLHDRVELFKLDNITYGIKGIHIKGLDFK